MLLTERGRSFVEILAVLTLIGVLTVGALSGFSYALLLHRSNEFINDINLLNTAWTSSKSDYFDIPEGLFHGYNPHIEYHSVPLKVDEKIVVGAGIETEIDGSELITVPYIVFDNMDDRLLKRLGKSKNVHFLFYLGTPAVILQE